MSLACERPSNYGEDTFIECSRATLLIDLAAFEQHRDDYEYLMATAIIAFCLPRRTARRRKNAARNVSAFLTAAQAINADV